MKTLFINWKCSKPITFLVVFVFFVTLLSAEKFQGLAQTPPMGWNSWNKFACNINEKIIREIADALVTSGMKDAGYEYVIIDDCWHGERDSLGFITANHQSFPSGIKALADYIHSRGFKFGIYSSAGFQTCAGRPGSRGHEYQDAYMYAKWGVDYLKYDWCGTDKLNAEGAYMTMGEAILQTGRPMVYSICEWGKNKPWEWGAEMGHLWRTTNDIFNCFDCVNGLGDWKSYGVMQILDMQNGLRKYSKPGNWNDPDMLEIGNGMPVNEERAHFSMWCMLAAPLISGNDLRNMSAETRNILCNKEAIAIDQDILGIQGFKHQVKDSVEIWLKPLHNNAWAITLLNRSQKTSNTSLNWNEFFATDTIFNRMIDTRKQRFKIRDIWNKTNIGVSKITTFAIPKHDVVMLLLTKE
ncbi:MAG: glycoside hydrolase family 27 protein [Paludibacter sp.]